MYRPLHRVLPLLFLLCMLLGGCKEQKPLRLGFVGGLSGRTADLGLAGRNGAQLAVEQCNAAGGLDGRRVELLIRDDRQDPDTARKVDRELVNAGVAAIIGHMTSQMSLAVQDLLRESGLVMVSPTSSTSLLSDLDDNFLRIYPSSADAAARLARHARNDLDLKRVLTVYDLSNRAHTEPWYLHFSAAFRKAGGELAPPLSFTSGDSFSYYDLARKIAAIEADGLFILANAIDTGLLCQQLRKLGFTRPILASEWSATEELIQFGGAAVNGLEFFDTFNRNSTRPRYLAFREAYRARFGAEPGFAAMHAYDATRLVLAGLRIDPQPSHLKQTLLGIKSFPALQGPLQLNHYGDVERDLFLVTIDHSRFNTILSAQP